MLAIDVKLATEAYQRDDGRVAGVRCGVIYDPVKLMASAFKSGLPWQFRCECGCLAIDYSHPWPNRSRPVLTRPMSKRIPDAGHPLVEEFAEHMYMATPRERWPEPFAGRTDVWEREPVAVREAFRDRARRFMAGDLSVAPWA